MKAALAITFMTLLSLVAACSASDAPQENLEVNGQPPTCLMSVQDFGKYTFELQSYEIALAARGVCLRPPDDFPRAFCAPNAHATTVDPPKWTLPNCEKFSDGERVIRIHPFKFKNGNMILVYEDHTVDIDISNAYEVVHGRDILDAIHKKYPDFKSRLRMSVTVSREAGSLMTIYYSESGHYQFDCYFNVDIRQNWKRSCLSHG